MPRPSKMVCAVSCLPRKTGVKSLFFSLNGVQFQSVFSPPHRGSKQFQWLDGLLKSTRVYASFWHSKRVICLTIFKICKRLLQKFSFRGRKGRVLEFCGLKTVGYHEFYLLKFQRWKIIQGCVKRCSWFTERFEIFTCHFPRWQIRKLLT